MAKSKIKAKDEDAPESASDWFSEIDSALKREKTWRDKARKVVKRYRDERDDRATSSRVNILWSNTEVLKSALYARTAKPDVRRRFPDTAQGNATSRAAAEVVERSVIYANDVGDVDDPISSAIDDVLLPGRGTCWVSYEPEIEGDEGYGVENDAGTIADSDLRSGYGRGSLPLGGSKLDDGAQFGEDLEEGGQEEQTPRIVSQTLTLDYVYWQDFCHGKARKWCDVPWVARRHVLRKDQFKSKFPSAKEGAKLAYKLEDDGIEDSSGEDGPEHVEVWEIWDRPSHRRLYIGRGYAGVLQSDDDPYGLTGLFPCPKPLTSVTTTDRLVPSPEFLQYQDQANELDIIATRTKALLEQLQFKGIYDGTLGGDKGPLSDVSKAGDGEFISYEGWQALKEKGGIEAAFGFWPIERIPPVIAELTNRAARLTQSIYEVTGISDIIRGSTDPKETLGAQQLKSQFGSMRMQKRQREVQRFIRDCYRMEAEIIAEHFTEETLKGITGLTFDDAPAPPALAPQFPRLPAQGGPAPQPMAPPAMAQGGMPQQAMQGMMQAGPNGVPSQGPQSPGQGIPGEMPQGAPSTPTEQKPTWAAIMAILRSDKMRGYRIDIETDATVLEDATQVKQERLEFAQALQQALASAYQAAMTAPQTLPLIKEATLFLVKTYKAGRSMEQSVEDAFDLLIKSPPQPPPAPAPTGKDPEVQKAELAAQVQADQSKLAIDEKKLQAEVAKNDSTLQADIAHKQAQIALEREKLMIEVEKMKGEFAIKQQDHALQQQTVQSDTAAKTQDFGLRKAAQNKTILDEATQQANDQLGGDQSAPPEGKPPLDSLLTSIVGAIEAGNVRTDNAVNQMANAVVSLAQTIAAPKRIVRGGDGRAVGVETVQTIQ